MFNEIPGKNLTTAKIELTDKQIMRTQLEAEKDLAEDLVNKLELTQTKLEATEKRLSEIEAVNWHLRCILRDML